MGTTANFGIRYPESEDLVIDGANDMQSLAEDVDAALLDARTTPVIMLSGDGTDPDDPNYWLRWETGTPVHTRGTWTFPSGDVLIVPPEPGVYLVTLNHHFDEGSFGFGPDGPVTIHAFLETRVEGAAQGTAVVFQRSSMEYPSQTVTPRLHIAGLAWVDDTPDLGIQARIVCDETLGSAGDAGARLQIHQLSRI
jgi:hypothetical protein